MVVSGKQWRDSAIHIQMHVSILPQTPLPSRLAHNIEQCSMGYTIDPCWLPILNIAVCTWPSQSPSLSLPPGNHVSFLSLWVREQVLKEFWTLGKSESESLSVVSDSLWPHGLYSPWNSPGQNIGVGSLSLLQGIFPTQGSNPGLPHCRQILFFFLQADSLPAEPQGSPRILEWVAYPFSSRFPEPGIKSGSPALQADSLPTELNTQNSSAIG